MYVVVETWSPKPAFLAATPENRAAFFEAVSAGLADLTANGIESLGWGKVDPSEEHSTEHTWFAVWRTTSTEAADSFLASVAKSGWYDYFQQTNIRGELRPADTVITEHLELGNR